jgi:hypothetical protein
VLDVIDLMGRLMLCHKKPARNEFVKTVIRLTMDGALTEISVSLLPQRVQHLQLLQQFETTDLQSFTLFATKRSVVAPNKQGLVVNQ